MRRRLVCEVVALFALVFAGLGVAAGASAAWMVQPSANPGPWQDNELLGVAATSSTNAWAVGDVSKGIYHAPMLDRALVERWNGNAWKTQPTPVVPGSDGSDLSAVAAVSRSDAWTAGDWVNGDGGFEPLIERWNGKRWKVTPTPNPGDPYDGNGLSGVVATSATNAWAVGHYDSGSGTGDSTLVERWNGTAWTVVPSPNVTGTLDWNDLNGVAATSSTNAWAVGDNSNASGNPAQTLVERWNGNAWRIVPSPNPGGPTGRSILKDVAAISSTDVWAVGTYYPGTGGPARTLVEHWNGRMWRTVPSPNTAASDDNYLRDIAAVSATNLWAVGAYDNGSIDRTLIQHWNGKRWRIVPSPNPVRTSNNNDLNGVAVTSGTSAWAVGDYAKPAGEKTLIEHWNGKRRSSS